MFEAYLEMLLNFVDWTQDEAIYNECVFAYLSLADACNESYYVFLCDGVKHESNR